MATLLVGVISTATIRYQVRSSISAGDLSPEDKMIHDTHKGAPPKRFTDIVSSDEMRPSIGRQLINGVTGMLVLLVTGLIILLLVLWKTS